MVFTREFKEVLAFEHPCYICGNIFSRAKQAIDHIQRIHGYVLPTRGVGKRRPASPHYEYQNNPATEGEEPNYDVIHYACPSCWYHCPEAGLHEFAHHILRVHKPRNIDPSKNENGRIKGGEVTDIDRQASVTATETSDGSPSRDDELTPEEYEDKNFENITLTDLMEKLDNLTSMFKHAMHFEKNE